MRKKGLFLTPLLYIVILGSSILPVATNVIESKAVEVAQAVSSLQRSEPRRFALVIGIDNYPGSPLRLPVNDAELIKRELESTGFEVTLVTNPTLGEFIQARDTFVSKINSSEEDATALFFYAGHAVQFDGHNYLIPAESRLLPPSGEISDLPSKAEFIDYAVDAQIGILNHLSESKASQVIFVLDACRDNPFNPSRRAGARPVGLSEMNTGFGLADTFILFAASPGQVAFDGDQNESNSPFTKAFAQAISQPGSSLSAVYTRVNNDVRRITEGRQRPYQEGILFDFMFIESIESPTVAAVSASSLDTGVEQRRYDIVNDGYELLKQVLSERTIDDIQEAAEDGNAEAQYLLAIAHWKGEGVEEDAERAAYWLRRSATRGFSRAQFAYGQRLFWGWGGREPDKVEGFDWWLVAAENGNASAMIEIGNSYLHGREGVPGEDLDKAEEYFDQALQIGSLEAETSLGYLYDERARNARSIGDTEALVQANERKLSYFQRGMRKGSSSSMLGLARMYRYGDHVEKDLQKAIELYSQSASNSNIDAAYELGMMYRDDTGTELEEAQVTEAVKYFRIAIDLGSATAGIELANLIANGKIEPTPEMSQEAIQLYEQAITEGHLRAASSLADLYYEGGVIERDLEKAEQYGLEALELAKMTRPDSEDAWPMHIRSAYYTLLLLYKEEGFQPNDPQLVQHLESQFGSLDENMKRFTVPIYCNLDTSTPFHVYVWDWDLEESPVAAQFDWVEQARGCDVPTEVSESFEQLYDIARENDVSYKDLTTYALAQAAEMAATDGSSENGSE